MVVRVPHIRGEHLFVQTSNLRMLHPSTLLVAFVSSQTGKIYMPRLVVFFLLPGATFGSMGLGQEVECDPFVSSPVLCRGKLYSFWVFFVCFPFCMVLCSSGFKANPNIF